jgi:hypothetical protein
MVLPAVAAAEGQKGTYSGRPTLIQGYLVEYPNIFKYIYVLIFYVM